MTIRRESSRLVITRRELLGRGARRAPTNDSVLLVVGSSVPRVDGVEKVTGKAKYVADLIVPGMIEGKFLRSPYAHARIRSIDTTEAEAMPGVVAVVTSKDFTDIGPYMGRGKSKDQPIIAIDRAITRANRWRRVPRSTAPRRKRR